MTSSYYTRNRERIREQQRNYYAANKERITAHRRGRYASLRYSDWYFKLIWRHYMNLIKGRIAAGPALLVAAETEFEAAATRLDAGLTSGSQAGRSDFDYI